MSSIKIISLVLLSILLFRDSKTIYNKDIVNTNNIYRTAIKFSIQYSWKYDASYYKISYPNGDVPSGGACSDVVIRVLRDNNIDLQQLIHEDIEKNFDLYPHNWGLTHPDPNIDHRRVLNIMTYFKRMHYDKPITSSISDYEPGDIISWELSPGVTHIGVLLTGKDVYHNIGSVSKIQEDFLFNYKIIGHYRLSL